MIFPYDKIPRNFYVIPTHDTHAINVKGDVYSFTTGRLVEPDDPRQLFRAHVFIDGTWIPIEVLLMDTFVGHLDLPIISSVPFPRRAGSLTYQFTSIEKTSDDEWFLNGYRFRRFPRLPDFMVSENGVVIDRKNYWCMHCKCTTNFYLTIALYDPTIHRQRKFMLNRVVYESYYGPIPDGFVVDHRDSNTFNNLYTNLQAITQADNIAKTFQEGHKQHLTYYPDDMVEQICQRMEQGKTLFDIMYEMQIPDEERQYVISLITKLRRGEGRPHIAGKYDLMKYNPATTGIRVPTEIQNKIIADIEEGLPMVRLKAKYPSVDEQVIRRIAKYANVPLNRKALTYAEVDEIAQYAKDHTHADTCAKYSISEPTLIRIMSGMYFQQFGRGWRVPEENRKVHQLTDEQRREAKERIMRGDKVTAIANDLGCSPSLISKMKQRMGLREPRRYLTPEEKQIIIERVLQGDSRKAIADDLNITTVTVGAIYNAYRDSHSA